MIPLWMWIRVEEPGRRRVAFPVPLFLAWLLLGALWLLLLPPVLLAALLSWPWGWGKPLLQAYFQLLVLFGSLSGLRIDVDASVRAGRDGPVGAGRDGPVGAGRDGERCKTTHIVLR